MAEQLYPRPGGSRWRAYLEKRKPQCRWRIDYDLIYDHYTYAWQGYYKTKTGAYTRAWWNEHIGSLGGKAVLHERHKRDDGKYYDFPFAQPTP